MAVKKNKIGITRPSLLPRNWVVAGGILCGVLALLIFLPTLIAWKDKYESPDPAPFPVTVDPANKTIIEDPALEALFQARDSGLAAAVFNAGDIIANVGALIASAPWYQSLAAADAPRVVVIDPGDRKEEVAQAFGKLLGWDADERHDFIARMDDAPPYLSEGVFAPGAYVVGPGASTEAVSTKVRTRFDEEVLARYGTSTDAKVPIEEALTIASMIERETSDKEEMRLISGIIWNRIFVDMRLQIDATLQYAKASKTAASANPSTWWPKVAPKDKYITSPYNTYQNEGLPPSPIANPSVAAVMAALAPKKTDCLYYFHDRLGGFHCSATYEGHVTLLKQYYGKGK